MPYQQLPPFTDDDTMPFGKHQGKKLKDVPGSYFDWWLDSDNTKRTIRLIKYCVANFDRIQKEIDE